MLHGLEQQSGQTLPRVSFPRKISKETYKEQSDIKSKRSQIFVTGPKFGNRKTREF